MSTLFYALVFLNFNLSYLLSFDLFFQDNSIAYWRKFVAEYYSPRAKKRWCLSLYNNVGHHALGVFPQAATVIFALFIYP